MRSPSSPESEILTLTNQPSSRADELTMSGVSASASLTSTTSPVTGDYGTVQPQTRAASKGGGKGTRARSARAAAAPFLRETLARYVDVACSLDGLDGPEGLALLDLVTHLREVHENDVAQGVRREVRDAHGADIAIDLDVFVGLGEVVRKRSPGDAASRLPGGKRCGALDNEAEHCDSTR